MVELNPTNVATDHLKFSPDILQRLGEELVPHIEQGVVELAKNSYDADATKCSIEVTQISGKPGLRIIDDGIGMSLEDINLGWLVLGGSRRSVGTNS